jgi:anthranilate synthase component I
MFRIKRLYTNENAFEVFKKIYDAYDMVFILESLTGPQELSEYSIIGFDPVIRVESDFKKFRAINRNGFLVHESIVNDPIQQLRNIMPRITNRRYRFIGGAVGYVSYDALRFWEPMTTKRKKIGSQFPIFAFGIFTDGLLFDRKHQKTYYFHMGNHSRIKEIEELLSTKKNLPRKNISFSRPRSEMNKLEFIKKVEKARHKIYEGDIFQAVISRRFSFNITGDPLMAYEKLRDLNPSPYMYFLKHQNSFIIGSSPEMLLRSNSQNVETFPIAGTRPVTKNDRLNKRLRDDLLSDEKEISEHTMLVDLARNDLGRVCEYGTVKTRKLMVVKKFSHVQHLVSHVVGKLARDKDCYDAFKALFPAGTVTGAPKVRAMEIIDELECKQRGPYAGALGYFSFNEACDFAITIRSLFVINNEAYVQAGAGIVMDSIPEKEWQETLQKAEVIFSALNLAIEQKQYSDRTTS